MSSNDKSRQRKRARTAETLTNLTSDEIAALSPADTARLLTRHEHGVAGCSDLARAGQRVDAYNRCAAELLRRIDPLPHGHPEREAARAKLWAMRPKVLQAMDELQFLQIKYAMQLGDTPTENMSRA